MIFTQLIVFFSAFFLATFALPVQQRAAAIGQIVCTDPATQLVEHDCNVALLGLGGGIAGAIEELRVSAASTTAASGTCRITATAINGGTTIDISKGRLEHGTSSTQGGFENLLSTCGPSPGTIIISGGANPTGDIQVSISAA